MDVSETGQNELKSVIMTRITYANEDRLAIIMSSNICELYFGVLSKFSHGKKINLDHGDSWRVMQLFVVGLMSCNNFTTKISKEIGVSSSIVREKKTNTLSIRKEYMSKYKKQEITIFRRKLSKQAKNVLLAKNSREKQRHRPEKLKATERVRSELPKKRP